jgi:hypothetical protein
MRPNAPQVLQTPGLCRETAAGFPGKSDHDTAPPPRGSANISGGIFTTPHIPSVDGADNSRKPQLACTEKNKTLNTSNNGSGLHQHAAVLIRAHAGSDVVGWCTAIVFVWRGEGGEGREGGHASTVRVRMMVDSTARQTAAAATQEQSSQAN